MNVPCRSNGPLEAAEQHAPDVHADLALEIRINVFYG
jgi:hypothetical protein